jgi:hypothetical protein
MAGYGRNGTAEAAISTKQQRAILALLSKKNVAEAAQQAKVGERTLWRWLGDPMFRVYLAGAEADMLDAATRRLLQLHDGAIETLQAIVQDSEANAGVRLRAAQAMLDYLLKLRELRNVEQRLTALEMDYAREQAQAAG